MSKYSKFGFTLGQQLTIDGKDVLITGFHNDTIFYRGIHVYNNGEGFCLEISDTFLGEIQPDILENIYDAYVAGLGAGVLSIKMPEKYIPARNTFIFETREWQNWNHGFNHGQQHEYDKQKSKEAPGNIVDLSGGLKA